MSVTTAAVPFQQVYIYHVCVRVSVCVCCPYQALQPSLQLLLAHSTVWFWLLCWLGGHWSRHCRLVCFNVAHKKRFSSIPTTAATGHAAAASAASRTVGCQGGVWVDCVWIVVDHRASVVDARVTGANHERARIVHHCRPDHCPHHHCPHTIAHNHRTITFSLPPFLPGVSQPRGCWVVL